MAKPKSPKKPAAKPKAPAPASPSTYNHSKDRRALRELIARHGPLDAAHREAFDDLITNEDRAALGSKTRAVGAFREGIAWAIIIDEAFAKYPARVKDHYAETRFAYFLDRLAALDAALEAQTTRRGAQAETRSMAADRKATARAARQTLLSKLRGFAGRRSAECKALEDVTGRTTDVTAIGASIRSLVELAQTWLARGDAKSKIQRTAAGLTPGVVDAALAAAEALTGAATVATLAGKRPAIDAPEVNLAEGSVLHEMEEAARCFEEAHEATQIIPRLTPGPATRHVLGPKTAPKKAASPPATDPSSPA